MSVIFDTTPVYGILGDGRLVQTSTYQEDGTNKYYVGGKIFYIDETATGATYTFYSRTGQVLTDIRVGDEPFAYSISGTPSKDKYYVFNANAVTNKVWTYKNASNAWVYNLLGTTEELGKGKPNTAIVMAADNGAYANYAPVGEAASIWNALKNLNTSLDKGCNDWFVPSKVELDTLKTARDRDGNALTDLFSRVHMWTSSEYSASNAYNWAYITQRYNTDYKYSNLALIAARGF